MVGTFTWKENNKQKHYLYVRILDKRKDHGRLGAFLKPSWGNLGAALEQSWS
jgi:hypothetical protein